MKETRREALTWVEVDLTAIAHNVRAIKRFTKGLPLMAVVKANAYGHGMIPVGKAALEAGADWLAVVSIDEALGLRSAGVKAPIFVLTYVNVVVPPKKIELAIRNDIHLAVVEREAAYYLASIAKRIRKNVKVHLKIDTGTTRVGVLSKDAISVLEVLHSLPYVTLEGIFTHFARAEETQSTYTQKQTRLLSSMVRKARLKGIEVPYVHAACSAALIHDPRSLFTLGRLGISLYGLWPSGELAQEHSDLGLKPALEWHTKIIQVKEVPKGTPIGYGSTYVTKRKSSIAVMAVGYADGFDRRFSNRAHVLVKGKKAKVRGRVCMNITMIDVTDIPDVQSGTGVTLLGRDGNLSVTADDLARWAGTISYEIVTRINWTLPRFFRRRR